MNNFTLICRLSWSNYKKKDCRFEWAKIGRKSWFKNDKSFILKVKIFLNDLLSIKWIFTSFKLIFWFSFITEVCIYFWLNLKTLHFTISLRHCKLRRFHWFKILFSLHFLNSQADELRRTKTIQLQKQKIENQESFFRVNLIFWKNFCLWVI